MHRESKKVCRPDSYIAWWWFVAIPEPKSPGINQYRC
jgi:hypothetical protein